MSFHKKSRRHKARKWLKKQLRRVSDRRSHCRKLADALTIRR